MLKIVYNNLVQSIERRYYQHGIYCSSNAYKIVACTCFIIFVMSIGILYSPLVHGNAVVEWRSGNPEKPPPARGYPQWLHTPPLASVQHIMLQLQHKSPFQAIQTIFSIHDKIMHTKVQTADSVIQLSDVCLHVSGGVSVKGLPTEGKCLFLTPTLLWSNSIVDFLSDPDITQTILNDVEIGNSGNSNLRALLFGASWTTPPHPIVITLFLNPDLPTTLITQFRETITAQLSTNYSVSILTEKEFKSDYMLTDGKSDLFGLEQERVHLFYSDKVNLMELVPLIILYVLVFIYIVISVRKITLVKSKVGLACVAVATIVFSFVMSLGFCVFFNLLPTLTGSDIFPYIFTLVGLENVLTITRSVTITAGDQDVHIRVAQGLSTEGTRITKNVCALAFMFMCGICSPVPPAFHEFCVVGLVCVICDFFLQLFFFVPVLSLDIRRLELSDIKSEVYPAPSVLANGKLPDWTDRPRKTRLFRHRATQKILMLSVFLYVCYVIYHSIWSTTTENSGKTLSVPSMLALGSTRIIQWILSSDLLQTKHKNKKTTYEDLFPHTFSTTDSTVDMLDQSWRRVARDSWPYLFKHYNIVVTARYFDVYRPIYVEDEATKQEHVTYQSQVRQWLQMPVTLHLISTLVGLVAFLPGAVFLYLCLVGISKLFNTKNSAASRTQQSSPILEVPYVFREHDGAIEHVVIEHGMVLSTSFNAETLLWDIKSGSLKLKITSEMLPWQTALSATCIVLGHYDGSVNLVDIRTEDVVTIQSQESGVTFLTFIDSVTLLIGYEDGVVEVVRTPTANPISTPTQLESDSTPPEVVDSTPPEVADSTPPEVADSTPPEVADSTPPEVVDSSTVNIIAKTRLYPGSLLDNCTVAGHLVACGGSNIVKVYDAYTLTVLHVFQLPRSVHTLHVAMGTVYAADALSSVFVCPIISTGKITDELVSSSGVVDKLLSTKDWVVGLCNNNSVVVWDKWASSQPRILAVHAVDISLLYEQYIFILEQDSVILWALDRQEYTDNISLHRYVSRDTGSDDSIRLKSCNNVAVVFSDSNVVPFSVLHC